MEVDTDNAVVQDLAVIALQIVVKSHTVGKTGQVVGIEHVLDDVVDSSEKRCTERADKEEEHRRNCRIQFHIDAFADCYARQGRNVFGAQILIILDIGLLGKIMLLIEFVHQCLDILIDCRAQVLITRFAEFRTGFTGIGA